MQFQTQLQTAWFWLKAALLGWVEGLTEFLPISSTAHLLLVGQWIGFDAGADKVYEIVIQLGAIMAVIWLYRASLWQVLKGCLYGSAQDWRFVRNVLLGVLPAIVVGLWLIRYLKWLLDGQFTVYATTLIIGGFVLLWVERRFQTSGGGSVAKADFSHSRDRIAGISAKQALVVGLAQCLAMVPGTSRSGASIVAAMCMGVPRQTATEFSFFLAIPTMIGAATLSLFKYGAQLSMSNAMAVGIGFVVAWCSAWLAVKALLAWVSRYSYRPFAWYRIVLGIGILLWVSL